MTLTTREALQEALLKHDVPEHMWGGIERYLFDRVQPGKFLRSVLENDLKEAACRADGINQSRLRNYMLFLYDAAPHLAWGSPEAVRKWLREEV